MEERARLIGGQLRVTSAPSEGTLVELRLPLMVPAGIPGIPDDAVDGGPALAAEAAAGRS
jgi:hypothetical protein